MSDQHFPPPPPGPPPASGPGAPPWPQQPPGYRPNPYDQAGFGGHQQGPVPVQPSPYNSPPPPQKSGGNKIVIYIAAAIIGCFVLCCVGAFGFFAYVGSVTPETYVVTGQQLAKRHSDKIQQMNLLEPGEQIEYFYSDALFSLEEGVYLLTDRHVVLYSNTWAEPKAIIPYDEIAFADFAPGSTLMPSTITLETDEGDVWVFPVSTEKNGDDRFYNVIVRKAGLEEQ